MEEMVSNLGSTVACLTRSLAFRDCADALAADTSILTPFSVGLEDVEQRLVALQQALADERMRLQRAKEVAAKTIVQQARIKAIQENLPPRLPGSKPAETTKATTAPHATVHSKCPVIPYVRKDEFEGVPISTRGRVSCDQINECVDAVNAALAAKYKLIAAPRATLGEPQMNKLVQFRSQESDDLKGSYFILEDDIKSFTSYKFDNTARTCMLVLRNLRRLRDHRTGGINRHVVCC